MKKLSFILLFLLTGCFAGESPTSEFYLLQPVATVAPVSSVKTSIGVRPAVLPSFLDRPHLVLQEADSAQVVFSETHRWADSLSKVIQRVLIDDLAAYLPNAYVKTKLFNREQFAKVISVEVNQMTATLGDKATLDVWWSVQKNDGTVLYRERTTLEKPVGLTHADYINVQSALMAELAYKIALKVK